MRRFLFSPAAERFIDLAQCCVVTCDCRRLHPMVRKRVRDDTMGVTCSQHPGMSRSWHARTRFYRQNEMGIADPFVVIG